MASNPAESASTYIFRVLRRPKGSPFGRDGQYLVGAELPVDSEDHLKRERAANDHQIGEVVAVWIEAGVIVSVLKEMGYREAANNYQNLVKHPKGAAKVVTYFPFSAADGELIKSE